MSDNTDRPVFYREVPEACSYTEPIEMRFHHVWHHLHRLEHDCDHLRREVERLYTFIEMIRQISPHHHH